MVGANVGSALGSAEGFTDGDTVGSALGSADGVADGATLGRILGLADGFIVDGFAEGAGVAVGCMLGNTVGTLEHKQLALNGYIITWVVCNLFPEAITIVGIFTSAP